MFKRVEKAIDEVAADAGKVTTAVMVVVAMTLVLVGILLGVTLRTARSV